MVRPLIAAKCKKHSTRLFMEIVDLPLDLKRHILYSYYSFPLGRYLYTLFLRGKKERRHRNASPEKTKGISSLAELARVRAATMRREQQFIMDDDHLRSTNVCVFNESAFIRMLFGRFVGHGRPTLMFRNIDLSRESWTFNARMEDVQSMPDDMSIPDRLLLHCSPLSVVYRMDRIIARHLLRLRQLLRVDLSNFVTPSLENAVTSVCRFCPKLIRLDLSKCASWSPLKLLQDCKLSWESLSLRGRPIAREIGENLKLKAVSNLYQDSGSSLTHLDIQALCLSPGHLSKLFCKLHSLRNLAFSYQRRVDDCNETDSQVAAALDALLSSNPTLTSLTIYNLEKEELMQNEQFIQGVFSVLSRYKQLTSLRLESQHSIGLQDFPSEDTHHTDTNEKDVSKAIPLLGGQMRELSITATEIGITNIIRTMIAVTSLQSLQLTSLQLDNESVKRLAPLAPQLRTLELKTIKMSDEGLQYIVRNFSKLRLLALDSAAFTSLPPSLSRMHEELPQQRIQLTDLKKLHFINCSHLQDFDSITELCPSLESLRLNHCLMIDDFSLQALCKGQLYLRHLDLCFCSRLTARCVTVLEELKCLQSLCTTGTMITEWKIYERLVRHLPQLQSLKCRMTSMLQLEDVGYERDIFELNTFKGRLVHSARMLHLEME